MPTLEELDRVQADISDNWTSYEVVGEMPDGAEIRLVSGGEYVRERSGYLCSPIAYSVRNGDEFFLPKWARERLRAAGLPPRTKH